MLNEKLGYRSPFIFGIIVSFLDLICRFLIIEVKDSKKWTDPDQEKVEDLEAAPHATDAPASNPTQRTDQVAMEAPKAPPISVVQVILTLAKSKRAFAAFFITFIYGYVPLTSD